MKTVWRVDQKYKRLDIMSPKVDEEILHLGNERWIGKRVNDFFLGRIIRVWFLARYELLVQETPDNERERALPSNATKMWL